MDETGVSPVQTAPPPMAVEMPAAIAPLLRQPAAILGGGASGQAVKQLLARIGAAGEIFDERPAAGRAAFPASAAARHRLVVFSPGFRPDHPWLAAARAAGCTCLGELDFASLFWRGRLVAVTGTNGKTTLTEFLAHALEAAGEHAFAVGNIGFPFSDVFAKGLPADAIAVCEVSSFQAETLQHFRADAALWTNFAEDHLERHPGMQAYFAAKWNLVAHTREDAVFAGSSVQRYAAANGWPLSEAAAVATEGAPPDERLARTVFASYPQRENFMLAHAWWRRTGCPEAVLYAAARSFRLGRHRLSLVGEWGGVSFWNDSKATNFHAVEAALSTFTVPVHLILGGRAKGGDLGSFVSRIAPRVRHAWLIGETRQALAEYCTVHRIPHTLCASFAEAVASAAVASRPGDHVVLSPAFASFDMFRSYADRGLQFEQLARQAGAAIFR